MGTGETFIQENAQEEVGGGGGFKEQKIRTKILAHFDEKELTYKNPFCFFLLPICIFRTLLVS